MGNRLEEGLCILCGTPLIQPNEWHCCSACVPKIRAMVLDAKKNPNKRKKIRIHHRK